MVKAIYEGLFTGILKVEIVAKYQDSCGMEKIICKVIEGNMYREKGSLIYTSILFLWLTVKPMGYAMCYEGKPDISNVPLLTTHDGERYV